MSNQANAAAATGRTVGFIGLGIMGRHMARHLQEAGYALQVYSRTRDSEAVNELLQAGAQWQDSPAAMARACDAVITMVGAPRDVEQIYFGSVGLFAGAKPGALLIDTTTSSPALAQRIAAEARQRGMRAIDAPVSGGEVGARNAKLSIMVGGSEADVELALPLLSAMGKNIVRQGEAGAGQHAKMANQIVIASTMMGVCEGLAYARSAGLDPNTVWQAISGGAAASFLLTEMGPRMIRGDDAPGFFIEHFVKDLGIALEEAQRMQLELPGMALARRMYTDLIEQGYGRRGTQALFRHYEAKVKA